MSLIALTTTTIKIGHWLASAQRDIQDFLLFYQITKNKEGNFEATLTVKFPHETMPPKGIQPHEAPFPITLPKKLRTIAEDFEKTKHDKAPYNLEYGHDGMAALKQEERLYWAMRQAFWNTHFQEVIDPLLEIQAQGKIGRIWLVVASEEAFVRNLPWELIARPYLDYPTPSQPAPNFTIVRTTCRSIEDFELQRKPRVDHQLKLLFVTSLPERLEERHKLLQVEAEQRELISRLMEGPGADTMEIDFAEIASLDEIDTLLREGGHHILHISGHGDFKQPKLSPEEAVQAPSNQPETVGLLVLEDEDGNRVDVSGQQLGERLKEHSRLRLVVLSNCNSAKAGAHGLAEDVAWQVDAAVIGMRFTVTDFAATTFTTALYGHLAEGKPLAEAFQAAQMALYRNAEAPGQRYPETEWFTPVLHLRGLVGALVHPQASSHEDARPNKLAGQMAHLDKNFVGRRRYLAQTKRVLEGPGHICLYGMKGIGKTALAIAAARKWAGDNVLYAGYHDDFEDEELMEQVLSRGIPATERLAMLQARFKDAERAVYILDDFGTDVGENHTLAILPLVDALISASDQKIRLILVAERAPRELGDCLAYIPVWKLTYAEQFRYLRTATSFLSYEVKAAPMLSDLEPIFSRLDGHIGAIKLLEKGLEDFSGDDWKSEILQQVEKVEETSKSWFNLGLRAIELDDAVQRTYAMAAVFFSEAPLAAFVAASEQPEEVLREHLAALQDRGACFWDAEREVFEVHGLDRIVFGEGDTLERLCPTMLADKVRRGVALRAGEWFHSRHSVHSWELSIRYFTISQDWEKVVDQSHSLQIFFQMNGQFEEAYQLCLSTLEIVKEDNRRSAPLGNLGTISLHWGRYENAIQYLSESLAIIREIGPKEAEGSLLNNIGLAYHNIGKNVEALDYLQRSHAIRKAIGNEEDLAVTIGNLAVVFNHIGDYASSIDLSQQALVLNQKIGNSDGEALVQNNIGEHYRSKGDFDRALKYYNDSLLIFRTIGNISYEGSVLNNISLVHSAQGDYDTALRLLEESLRISQLVLDPAGEGTRLNNIGQIYKAQGNYEAAKRYNAQAYQVHRTIGHELGIGVSLGNLGSMEYAIGNTTNGLSLLNQSLAIFRKIGNRSKEAATWHNLGDVYLEISQLDKALYCVQQGLEIRNEIDGNDEIGSSYGLLSEIYSAKGDNEAAFEYANKNLKFAELKSDKMGISSAFSRLGAIAHASGKSADALRCFENSLSIAEELGNLEGIGTAMSNIAQVYEVYGEYEKAMDKLRKSLSIMENLGHKVGIAVAMFGLGNIHIELGNYRDAIHYLGESLKLAKDAGHKSKASRSLNSLGFAYFRIGEVSTAKENFERSLTISKEIQDLDATSTSINGLAQVATANQQFEKAEQLLREQLELLARTSDIKKRSSILDSLGFNSLAQEDFKSALDYFTQSLEIQKKVDHRKGIGAAHNNIGTTLLGLHKLDAALDQFRLSLEITKVSKDEKSEGIALYNIGQTFDMMGNLQKALYYLKLSLSIKKKSNDKFDVASNLLDIGTIFIDLGQFELSVPYLFHSYQLLQEINSPFVSKPAMHLDKIINMIGRERFKEVLFLSTFEDL